ncbi:MAG: cell division protein FtsQ/DivIB, partial [Solirubrobacteraceae bacterium]
RVPPRALLALVVAAAVLGGGWMWLRDSSLVQVREVQITGSSSSQEARIRAALEAAARDMTTLHVRDDSLRAAAAQFSSVADLRIETDFPHAMRIEVVEHEPVAVLVTGDHEIAAAGSGLLLRGVVADSDLPVIRMDAAPAGERVDNGNTRVALRIAAAAPDELRRRIDRLWTGPEGMMLALVDGPDLIFGDAADAHRKWLAAGRVLADPGSAGATYLDLRTPERVAAGGLGPVPEPTPQPTPEANPQP